ncbi:hypothetical protein E4U21_003302 [Claviceps maximensis]|nr:hypothetical protein E4U21_003302 [Claviceps maximensis]
MPITRITNVDLLDARGRKTDSELTFDASSGNIISTDAKSDIDVDGQERGRNKDSNLTSVARLGTAIPTDAEPDIVVNGQRRTLMPGLIDAKLDSGPSDYALPLCADNGATTTMDSSSSTSESRALRDTSAGNPIFPIYLASGSAIGPENADLVSMLNYSGVQTVRTGNEARKIVEMKLLSKQADFIKIIVDQPGLRKGIIEAAVIETHEQGKLAIAQASQIGSYRLAIELGFDMLSPVPVDGELNPEMIEGILEGKIGIIPTLCFLEKALPMWRTKHPEYQFSYALEAVRVLNNAGVRICAGSSSNNWAGFSIPFGKGLHNELQLLAKAGLSNQKLISAVTSVPADLFRLRDRGLIEPGRLADLVMVDGDPLKDIEILSKIRSIWFRGLGRRA